MKSDTSKALLASGRAPMGRAPGAPPITKAPLYCIWDGMVARCHRPANKNYFRYGARGIFVCDRWRADFWAFAQDMGPRPSLAHSIERVDNNKGYAPENCVWATAKEQCANKRPCPARDVCRLRGHPLTPENTYVYPQGSRSKGLVQCKLCHAIGRRARYEAKRKSPSSNPIGVQP